MVNMVNELVFMHVIHLNYTTHRKRVKGSNTKQTELVATPCKGLELHLNYAPHTTNI